MPASPVYSYQTGCICFIIFSPSLKSVTFFFKRLSDGTSQKPPPGLAAEFLESSSWNEGELVPIPTLPLAVFIDNPKLAPLLPHNPILLSSTIPTKPALKLLAAFINHTPAVGPPRPLPVL